MTAIRPVLALLAGGLLMPGAPAAEPAPPLGRLFLTPEWRAALDRQRQLNIQETRDIENDAVRLDGVVVRSSGRSTIWINNQPREQNPNGGSPNVPAGLKVGATLDPATGQISDGLAGGEIRTRRSAQPK